MNRAIECPDDLPTPFESDDWKGDAHRDALSDLNQVPTYVHRPVSREQLIDAINFGRQNLMPCGVQVDPEKFRTINGGSK